MNNKELSLPYRCLRAYIRFMVERVYYRKAIRSGLSHVPSEGTPLLVVSNHQNSLNDALGILFGITDRKVHFIVRADVFALSPLADKFLRWIGLLPAFRLAHEGEEALASNGATFRDSEQALIDGHTVVIYPEAGHQDKRWLGDFSYGYTRMAFEAAELGHFEKDIQILPSCNHYSEYFGYRTDMLVKFGTPVSLQPYYELYQTKPRTAQREVSRVIREQISSMMLDIRDLEHYDDIDFLRGGSFGRSFAKAMGCDPDNLEEKLASDKALVSALGDGAPDGMLEDARALREGMQEAGITLRQLDREPSVTGLVLRCMALVLLLPLAVFCLYPSAIVWLFPAFFWRRVERKTGDKMFRGTFLIALTVLFSFPLLGLVTLLGACAAVSLPVAIVWVALFPLICLFEWQYAEWVKRVREEAVFLSAGEAVLQPLRELRRKLLDALSGLHAKKYAQPK